MQTYHNNDWERLSQRLVRLSSNLWLSLVSIINHSPNISEYVLGTGHYARHRGYNEYKKKPVYLLETCFLMWEIEKNEHIKNKNYKCGKYYYGDKTLA